VLLSAVGKPISITDVTGLQDALNSKQAILPYVPERSLTFQAPLTRVGDTVNCPSCGGTSSGTSSGAAAFVKTDTTTLGNWSGVYGKDGYNIIGDNSVSPAYAILTPLGAQKLTWDTKTTDVRALQRPSNPNQRIAAAWYVDEAIGTFSA